MILCVGEILADMTAEKNGDDVCYRRNAGSDAIGRFLKDFAEKRLKNCYVRLDDEHNTTLAFVDIDESGERSFSFYRKNTADYFLPEVPADILNAANIVSVGSLMLSTDSGLNYALNLIEAAKNLGKLVAFDVNFRSDIFRDKTDAVRRYKQIIEKVDILKLTDDEEEIFSKSYIDGLKNTLVLVSMGCNGSRWQYTGKGASVPTIKVDAKDTTGAGDAFNAGVLTRLDGLSKSDWTEKNLNAALRFGNVCGALNTLGSGAIANLPSLSEIKKYL